MLYAQSYNLTWVLVAFLVGSVLDLDPEELWGGEGKSPRPFSSSQTRCPFRRSLASLGLAAVRVLGSSPCMQLYSYTKHVHDKNLQFGSHLTRTPCCSHNVRKSKTPSAFFCVLWSENAFFWQPFQRGCGYGGGVWWCFLKPGDPKTPPRPAIHSLWSLGILLILSPFSSVFSISHHSPILLEGKMQLRPLPIWFSTVTYRLNFFIVALTVLSGIFNHSCSHYHITTGLKPSAFFEQPIILFSSWCWMTKGYYMCVTSFLYPNETV